MQDSSVWTLSMDTSDPSNPKASLLASINGGAPQATLVKGVCYSPCPINAANSNAPNIGDWFWDSFSGPGYAITNWSALWTRDMPNLQSLGVNMIRVYSMLSRQLNSDGSFPNPWNSGQLMTHQQFLDTCWNGGVNPIYVLVGIPMPQLMFWLSMYKSASPTENEFWTNVLQETVEQLANHPAVMGFSIQNEVDAGGVTYGPDTATVEFWWRQVEKFAQIAKTAAPNKLVGMAVHDDPNICGQAQSYMAKATSLDFWGVNSYQTITFQSVFGETPNGPGYAGLTGAALKPLIFTEYGIPATGHSNPNDASTIYADSTTIQNTANILANMLPQGFGQPPPSPNPSYPSGIGLGLFYFEYSDEWWNQGGSPNIYTWWGGNAAAGFPNGFWDQDGFGIYSIARGGSLSNDAPTWVQNGGYGGPNTPVDTMSVRSGIFDIIQSSYRNA